MKRKSFKGLVREFVLASDSELAKESVITCYEFADRKCIANIEKITQRNGRKQNRFYDAD